MWTQVADQKNSDACRSETDCGETCGSQQALPLELQLAIRRDALLMHMWQRQREEIQWWIVPLFNTWMRITHYEREWPGSTEPAQPGRATVVWEP